MNWLSTALVLICLQPGPWPGLPGLFPFPLPLPFGPEQATPRKDPPWPDELFQPYIDQELLDPREAKLYSRDESLDSFYRLIAERQVDLADAPRLSDIQWTRMPDRKFINDQLALNREIRRNFDELRKHDAFLEWKLKDAIDECDWLYHVWDTMRDAQCDYYYVTVRRQALSLLRERVGSRAYYSGNFPPVYPYWYFPRTP